MIIYYGVIYYLNIRYIMPRNGYRSHRGRSAVARRTEFGGASGTNGIMPSVVVMTTAGKSVRTNYFGGNMKGGSAPSGTGFMRSKPFQISANAQRPNFLFNFRQYSGLPNGIGGPQL